jgi:glyoxylase-like metal-dependent hydrolase (beta-lactamase superfamily II)
MLRERVADDIYVFTSEMYAQVTAGMIVSPEGAILIDTLPFPMEAREIQSFIPQVCPEGVKYIILTHYHADHTYGAYLFPEADVVCHDTCRRLLIERGQPALEAHKDNEPLLSNVKLRPPDITFKDGDMGLQLGGKVARLIHAPGHTQDLVMVYIEDDLVLFAADLMMPVPSIVDGDIDTFRTSLQKILDLPEINNMVQGHGEVILVGEVDEKVKKSLDYLNAIEEIVEEAIESGEGEQALRNHDVESIGISRLPLHGQVQQIHRANLLSLYDRKTS